MPLLQSDLPAVQTACARFGSYRYFGFRYAG
jgi:hypothetical protein